MLLKFSNSAFTIRIFDILISFFGLIVLSPIFGFIYFLISLEKNNSPLFLQERLGKNKKKFTLVKFRTMRIDTKNCATHLVNPNKVTKIGRFLRKTKLDEIPQLWNVLKGDMSMVGPRPCLTNQKELITKRENLMLYKMKPGITGIAQIKKIDMSNPNKLVNIESQMMLNFNLYFYFYCLILTFVGIGFGDRINYSK